MDDIYQLYWPYCCHIVDHISNIGMNSLSFRILYRFPENLIKDQWNHGVFCRQGSGLVGLSLGFAPQGFKFDSHPLRYLNTMCRVGGKRSEGWAGEVYLSNNIGYNSFDYEFICFLSLIIILAYSSWPSPIYIEFAENLITTSKKFLEFTFSRIHNIEFNLWIQSKLDSASELAWPNSFQNE